MMPNMSVESGFDAENVACNCNAVRTQPRVNLPAVPVSLAPDILPEPFIPGQVACFASSIRMYKHAIWQDSQTWRGASAATIGLSSSCATTRVTADPSAIGKAKAPIQIVSPTLIDVMHVIELDLPT